MDEDYFYEDDEDYDDEFDEDEPLFDQNNVEEASQGVEKDRERIIEILRSATDRTLSTWAGASEKELYFSIDYACHATLKIPKGLHLFASCFDARETEKTYRNKFDETEQELSKGVSSSVAERYWSWMTGSDSPWKLLFERSYPERIEDKDGQLVGFFLDPVAAHEKFKLAYNFCIAMRMIGEERSTIQTWSTLVDQGMRESDALYLARMIKPTKDSWCERSTNDSCHWPLLNTASNWSSGDYKYLGSFNFKRFREGDFDFKAVPETRGWVTAPYREDFSLRNVPKETKNYRHYFKLEDIICEFTKWVNLQEETLIQKIKRKVAA